MTEGNNRTLQQSNAGIQWNSGIIENSNNRIVESFTQDADTKTARSNMNIPAPRRTF